MDGIALRVRYVEYHAASRRGSAGTAGGWSLQPSWVVGRIGDGVRHGGAARTSYPCYPAGASECSGGTLMRGVSGQFGAWRRIGESFPQSADMVGVNWKTHRTGSPDPTINLTWRFYLEDEDSGTSAERIWQRARGGEETPRALANRGLTWCGKSTGYA